VLNTGGEATDPEMVLFLIEHLKRYGAVLTEHIGDVLNGNEVNVTDEEIFLRDVAWLREADVLVAEVTAPSLGVGYEIGVAEALGKPVLCLHRNRQGRRLSAMLAGNHGLVVRKYGALEEALWFIDEFIESSSAIADTFY
jgi:nucleoside 2-deoxyribosyltransferase